MIGLLVFFALAIPVAIHLLSRSQGKVLPFPFLGLLPKQVAATEIQVKLRQKRLLLLRLLLIFCACLLVSVSLLNDWWMESEWRGLLSSKSPAPTLVITQDWWLTSNEENKQDLKEQLNSEAFAPVQKVFFVDNTAGMNRIIPISVQKVFAQITSLTNADKQPTGNSNTTSLTNVWSTAQAIATNIPADSPLHIYTSKRYAQFLGAPTHVRQPAFWHFSDSGNNNDNTAQNLDKAAFQIALIGLNRTSSSPEQILRMARTEIAIQSLKSAFPAIEVVKISNENVDSLASLATQYDVLLIDSIDKRESIGSNKLIQINTLPNSSQANFVFALGKEIFRHKQQEHLFSKALLSPEQIEMSGNTVRPQAISSIANKQTPPWEPFLAILLLTLFLLERFMSEQQDNTRSSKSLDKQNT